MRALFSRARAQSPASHRMRGLADSVRASGAVQLGTQLLLWLFFFGYDRASQAVWQAALMLLLPLAAVWLLWRRAPAAHPAARKWLLLLLPCLFADAVLLITVLGGFISQLVPGYPAWVTVSAPAAVCAAAALRARARGVSYGSAVLCAPLVLLVLLGTVFLRASTRPDRLFPILGDGLIVTARAALQGAGAVWGAALLFIAPQTEKAPLRSALWALAPWGLCALCALWFGFLNPWLPGDDLPIAEKMMGLARHAHSVILYESAGVMWMLLIPAALTACFSAGGQIVCRAFPRMPEYAGLAPVPAAALCAALWMPDTIFAFLQSILPWRLFLCLACGCVLPAAARRRA